MALPARTPRGGAIDVLRTIVVGSTTPHHTPLIFVLEDEKGRERHNPFQVFEAAELRTTIHVRVSRAVADVSLQVTTRCGTTGDTRETPLGNFDSHTTQFLECATETAEVGRKFSVQWRICSGTDVQYQDTRYFEVIADPEPPPPKAESRIPSPFSRSVVAGPVLLFRGIFEQSAALPHMALSTSLEDDEPSSPTMPSSGGGGGGGGGGFAISSPIRPTPGSPGGGSSGSGGGASSFIGNDRGRSASVADAEESRRKRFPAHAPPRPEDTIASPLSPRGGANGGGSAAFTSAPTLGGRMGSFRIGSTRPQSTDQIMMRERSAPATSPSPLGGSSSSSTTSNTNSSSSLLAPATASSPATAPSPSSPPPASSSSSSSSSSGVPLHRTNSAGWRRATTETAGANSATSPRPTRVWVTSALVVSRLAANINRVALASRESRAATKLASSTSAFAPELFVLSPPNIRVKRRMITTIDTDEFGQELTLSLWCFDWAVPLHAEPQTVRYQLEYAGKKTSDLYCYRVPAAGDKPNLAYVPMLSSLNDEFVDNIRATWNFATNQHLHHEPYHVLLLKSNGTDTAESLVHDMISSVFPDVAEADKTNPCSWDWRTDVEAVTNSPFRQPQWHRRCYGDLMFSKEQRRRLFIRFFLHQTEILAQPQFTHMASRIPLVVKWQDDVDIMFLADRTNRNIVLDVVKEVFCLFRLGKLPSLSASVQREYTPVIQEENPFDARLTVSADTLQIGLIDAGTGVLAATLVPMVSSAQTSFDSIVSRNNAAVPSTADTPTLPPMHDLVVRTMKPIDQADITTVESVVNITQLLQKLPDSEREAERTRLLFLRGLLNFLRSSKCRVLCISDANHLPTLSILEVGPAGLIITNSLPEHTLDGAFVCEKAGPPTHSSSGDSSAGSFESPRGIDAAAPGSRLSTSSIPKELLLLPPSPSYKLRHPSVPFLVVFQHHCSAFHDDREVDYIWDEAEDGPWNVITESASHEDYYTIRAASFNKLIQRLTTPPAPEAEQAVHDNYELFVKMFFMTYRAFASRSLVFQRIIARYRGPPLNAQALEESDPPLSRIRYGVCKVLVHWFSAHLNDFDERARQDMSAFTEEAKQQSVKDKESGILLSDQRGAETYLRSMFEKKLAKGSFVSMFDTTVLVHNPPPPIVPESWKGVTFMDLDELEIARQLTITESHLYLEIRPVELQNLAWSKPKLKHRAPNLLALIEHFNNFSMKCATLIVTTEQLRRRRMVVEKLIRIAQHCLDLNNFNMAMSILAAFNNSSVHRLKFTFAGISKKVAKTLATINEHMSSSGAYKSIRQLLANVKPPCIPFLGVYMSDLTFVEDGNPDRVHGGLVNFRKRKLEYDIIVQLLAYQTQTYNLNMVHKIVAIIDGLEMIDDNACYEASLRCEPRNATKKSLT